MVSAEFTDGMARADGPCASGSIAYPAGYFLRAYARSAAGLAAALAAWYLIPGPATAAIAGLGVAAAFVLYAVQIRLRQVSEVHWDEVGIRRDGPLPRHLPWSDLRDVELAYYSTRRDGANGWMQLKIKGKPGVLRFDSDASGFGRLAVAALHHADRVGLDVTAVTRHNAAVLVGPGGFRPS